MLSIRVLKWEIVLKLYGMFLVRAALVWILQLWRFTHDLIKLFTDFVHEGCTVLILLIGDSNQVVASALEVLVHGGALAFLVQGLDFSGCHFIFYLNRIVVKFYIRDLLLAVLNIHEMEIFGLPTVVASLINLVNGRFLSGIVCGTIFILQASGWFRKCGMLLGLHKLVIFIEQWRRLGICNRHRSLESYSGA